MLLEYSVRKLAINPKFKYSRFRTSFVLDNIKQAEDTSELLKDCIQNCIDKTIEESKTKGIAINRIGVIFSSKLLHNDIYIPIHKVTKNTADAILNKLEIIWQENIQRCKSLFDAPLILKITGIHKARGNRDRMMEE